MIARAIEGLITIDSPASSCRWLRDEGAKPRTKYFKGGQHKLRKIRELAIQIAKTTGFGYTRILGELRKLGIEA